MSRPSILILFSLPSPFLPDGTRDVHGQESVLSRLSAVEGTVRGLGHRVQVLEASSGLDDLIREIRSARPDLVFNLCEEFMGQTCWEMNIAALLEVLGLPFTGSPAFVLGLSQDKGKTKSILAHHGLPTPAFRVVPPGEAGPVKGLNFPLIVKPVREDASLGIDNSALVLSLAELEDQVRKIHRQYAQPALVEEYIDGREINVSILGNAPPRILPISEIDFSGLPPGLPRICGYAAKWLEDSPEFQHSVPRCPASFPPQIEEEIRRVALAAYRLLDCRDYARVDLRLSPAGVPYLLEVNANPDISPDAGIVRSAQSAGLSYGEFIGRLLHLSWSRTAPGAGKVQGEKRAACRRPG